MNNNNKIYFNYSFNKNLFKREYELRNSYTEGLENLKKLESDLKNAKNNNEKLNIKRKIEKKKKNLNNISNKTTLKKTQNVQNIYKLALKQPVQEPLKIRKRVLTLTENQRERKRERDRERLRKMTPEQKEKKRQQVRESRKKRTPEQKERNKKYQREWYLRNKERRSAKK
tara:strand:- start:3334 stop:3846 length:513 start_codon:yes stop_codon:yes gene_type:complete